MQSNPQEVEAEKKFLSQNFQESIEWKSQQDKLQPQPSQDKSDSFKRKWFKNNINTNLSLKPVNLAEANKTQDFSANSNKTQQKAIDSTTYTLGILMSVIHLFSYILIIIGIFKGLFLAQNHLYNFGMKLNMQANLASLAYQMQTSPQRQPGIKNLASSHTLMLLISQENLYCLFYGLLIQFQKANMLQLSFPLLITSIMLSTEFMQWIIATHGPKSLRNTIIKLYRNQYDKYRTQLISFKQHLEVINGWILLFACIVQLGRPIVLLAFYWNITRIKYAFNNELKRAFQTFNYQIDCKLVGIPMAKKVWDKIKSLGAYMTDLENIKKNSLCVIV